jgi:hypothetical protein
MATNYLGNPYSLVSANTRGILVMRVRMILHELDSEGRNVVLTGECSELDYRDAKDAHMRSRRLDDPRIYLCGRILHHGAVKSIEKV